MNDDIYFERVEKIRKKMVRIAYSYFQSESTAVDVVDEVIYQGYLKKGQLNEERYMETWLVRILMNTCCNKIKKYNRQVEYMDIDEPATEDYFEKFSLKEALNHLPLDCRQMVSLKFFSGYTVNEIAGIMNLPSATVRSRLTKSLKLLRMDLEVQE